MKINSQHMERRRNKLLQDTADFAARRMAELGIDSKAADLIATDIADHLADVWGGQTLNFPKDYLLKLSLQEDEVYRKFNGNNYAELALEYGISERGMQKKIARIKERLRRQAANAPTLFETLA